MAKSRVIPGLIEPASSKQTKKSPRSKKTTVKNAPDDGEIKLKISNILDAFPFYVMLVDEEHHILQVNNVVRSALGIDPQAIVGKYCPSAVHGLDKPIDNCPLEEAARTDQAVEREIFDPASKRWIRSCIYPIKGSTADGKRIFFHMITDISDRKQAEENLRISQDQLRELALHLESVREEERTSLAREIHDELGQLLTGLKMDASWMTKKIPQSEASLVEKTRAMGDMIDEAIETVKRVSAQLRPAVLDYLGLAAAIEWQTKELEKHSEISFEFKSNPRDIVLDRERSTAIFRICQEALTNVVRHASATRVKVALKEEHNRIVLKIKDNGKGIDEGHISDLKSFGLLSMKERARHWGGQVEIRGTPGKGTMVLLSIPLTHPGES
jgi:PAS domain S-box-containing protein